VAQVAIDAFDVTLLVGAAVLLVSVLAVRLSVRVGLPSLLIYLVFGLLLGQDGPGGVQFDNAQLAQTLSFAALIVILSEGGLTTRWKNMRPAMPVGLSLAVVGTLVSTCVVALAVHYLLGQDWELAFLVGAVTAPTDAAAVFSVLRAVPLPKRLAGALEAESGFNDAPVVLLVTVLSTSDGHGQGLLALGATMLFELIGGTALGLLVGWAGAKAVRRIALPSSGLYPLAVLGLCVLAYAGATQLHMSGFAAVYVAALVLGNAALPHRRTVQSFAEGLGWIAQIGLFVMLGLLAWPSRIAAGDIAASLLIAAVLMLVARPLAVIASAAWRRVSWRDQVVLAAGGLRGAVPIVLCTIPLANGVPGASQIFDVVFVLVFVLTLVQSPLVPVLAKRLGLEDDAPRDLEVEVAPLDRVDAELMDVAIEAQSRLHGVQVRELRLPGDARLALVVRGDRTFPPEGDTVLRRGDRLVVVASAQSRQATEDRLRALSRRGRLGGWTGAADPERDRP
jgi:potassium/hydrogen antiporter